MDSAGKERGKVTVVLDSQAGSCGKGKFIGYIAGKEKPQIAINNFMTNAGHTYVKEYLDGSKTEVMTQHLPTSIVNLSTDLIIGPGAAITPETLFAEVIKYDSILQNRIVRVHPRAVVIKEEHRQLEAEILRSGSTFKGCGTAQADKITRQAELFGTWWEDIVKPQDDGNSKLLDMGYTEEEMNTIYNHIGVADCMDEINNTIDMGYDILVEGSQGCDLDINYGLDYPHTTSRQCHAGQLLADCGISPRLVTDIVMVMRPYPIRISNTTNLKDEDGNELVTSSGDYAGSEELTWDIIKERCGAPDDAEFGEYTTVTKKLRRVFELNIHRLKYVVKLNRPTAIALNFVQYIDYDALYCTAWYELPQKVKDYVEYIEGLTGVPVKYIGTGASNEHIIER